MPWISAAVLAWLSALAVGGMTLLATGEGAADFMGLAMVGSVAQLLVVGCWYVPTLSWLASHGGPVARTPLRRALMAAVVLNAPVAVTLARGTTAIYPR